ncbi:hypothetical protein [Corynebacterium bovis]|uniref:Uncharacterized protein n=1 Tax=Corynebacterium bovis TaxID=36808 RepID=A0A3R8VUE8_9CORY|nr:hypothetical protein [Corynebacterium bovis]MDN8579022.1 hypothetical protein [Corynebacterium bovis]RRO87033.1 hypothetical protein CXF48_04160 [Corynebacterium bovis]RRO90052.1 hypothetical protein CXF30_01490 [Corynebacterium bovis]
MDDAVTDRPSRREPRPTELDRAQATALLAVVVFAVAAQVVAPPWVKVVAAVVVVLVAVGLGVRVWRDRTGRWR